MWNWGIAHRGAAAASSFSLLTPIVSGVLSAVTFGEVFDLSKLVGAGLVLLGLLLLQRGPSPAAYHGQQTREEDRHGARGGRTADRGEEC